MSDRFGYGEIGLGIESGENDKQTTNADRIRSMTDEELAEFIIGVCHEYYEFRRKIESGRIEFIEWPKSPMEGEP